MFFRVLVGDYCNYNSSGVVLHVGGNYDQNQNHGLFYLNGSNAASDSNGNVGSRLLAGVSPTCGRLAETTLGALAPWVQIPHTSW